LEVILVGHVLIETYAKPKFLRVRLIVIKKSFSTNNIYVKTVHKEYSTQHELHPITSSRAVLLNVFSQFLSIRLQTFPQRRSQESQWRIMARVRMGVELQLPEAIRRLGVKLSAAGCWG